MTRAEKWFIWLSAALTGGTGLGLLWTKYFVQPSDPWAVVNHPLQPWFLKAHILVAPLLVFALGMISVRHVWRHLANGQRRVRGSGVLIAVTAPAMIVTGYLIQTVTHTGWLTALAMAHIGFSTLFLIALPAHRRGGRLRGGVAERSGDGPAARAGALETAAGPGSAARRLGRDPEMFAGRK